MKSKKIKISNIGLVILYFYITIIIILFQVFLTLDDLAAFFPSIFVWSEHKGANIYNQMTGCKAFAKKRIH